MKIGELAQKARCDVETIRYYEREGLLPKPGRTMTNYRLYRPEHSERLTFIRRCRSLDMTLQEIRTLLAFHDSPEASCREVNRLLEDHLGHVTERIEQLIQLERQLKRLRRQCRQVETAKNFGILFGLASNDPMPDVRTMGHVSGAHGNKRRTKRRSLPPKQRQ